jgi:hypothetical protein
MRYNMHTSNPDRAEVEDMARAARLKRKSFFVDEKKLGQARKALGVDTDAEAVRLSIEWVAEMEVFWKFMSRTRGKLKPGSVNTP